MPQISPVPAAPSAPPGHGASTSSATGDTPATSFMDVLTDHQARTDLPEGQARGDESPQATSDQPPAAGGGAGAAPVEQPDVDPTVTAEALAAALAAVPVVAPAAVTVADAP